MAQGIINQFAGINSDDDERLLGNGDFRYALNISLTDSSSSSTGVITNIKGNTLVSYALPEGENKVIGSYQHRERGEVYYFLCNSLSSHQILRYKIHANVIEKIYEWSGLNFSTDHLITGIVMIDDLLIWTDGYNPQRKINVEKAIAGSYGDTLVESFVDLIKYPPAFPPKVALKFNPAVKYNYIKDKTFQFRTRYVYDDNEKSCWSAISKLAFSPTSPSASKQNSLLNYVEVDFSDTRLSSADNLIIKRVEIAAREGNSGKFRFIKSIEREDYLLSTIFDFYNDGAYSVIGDAESNKLFDAIPRQSSALTIMKNRLFLDKKKEGFDPVQVDATLNLTLQEPTSEGKWNVKGRIYITHTPQSSLYCGIFSQTTEREGMCFFSPDERIDGAKDLGNFSGGRRFENFLPSGGFVVYLAGTPFYAVSRQIAIPGLPVRDSVTNAIKIDSNQEALIACDTLAAQEIYSEFEIKNVPPGEYALRIASHYVSPGDALGKGAYYYDLNDSSLSWQKTSTYVAGVGAITSGYNSKQQYITLADNGTGGDFTVDNFIIRDISTRYEQVRVDNGISGHVDYSVGAICGYLLDDATTGNLSDGVRISNQKFLTLDHFPDQNNFPFPNDRRFQTNFTDHNGFFFRFGKTPCTARFEGTDSIVIKDHSQNAYFASGLKDIAAPTGPLTSIFSSAPLSELLCFNHNVTFRDSKKVKIKGQVVDSQGSPLKDIAVVLESSGEFVFTDAEGNFEIITFVNAAQYPTGGNAIFERLAFHTGNAYGKPFGSPNLTLNITGVGTTYNATTTPYDLPSDVIISFLAVNENLCHLKRGGTYEFGLVYYDRANRSGAVNTSPDLKLYIPFITEATPAGAPLVEWSISHTPPEWATHYAWVRTKNSGYNSYFQWAVKGVRYVQKVDREAEIPEGESLPPVILGSKATAKDIYIDISNIIDYSDRYSNSLIGYSFEHGDRLRLIANENGDYFTTLIDLEIKGMWGASEIIVENLLSLPELKAGVVVEILTPKLKEETKLFYEIGETYPIVNPHTPERTHGVPSTPAYFTTGDTYRRIREIPVGSGISFAEIEHASVSDFYESQASDIGRINIENKDAKQLSRGEVIGFSNKYIPDTAINGLASFEALNEEQLPKSYGPIRVLSPLSNILLSIHELETVSLYIGEAIYKDTAGAQVIAISDRVIGSYRPMVGGYGTINPESFAIHNNAGYFYDLNKGAFVRVAQDGLTPISNYKFRKWSFNKSKAMLAYKNQSRVWAAVDAGSGEYVACFGEIKDSEDVVVVSAETVAFAEGLNRWSSFYSYHPEGICMASTGLLTFKNGELWLHGQNLYNSFYGLPSASRVTLVCKENPFVKKVFRSIAIESNSLWLPVEITNSYGQKTSFVEADFEKMEDVYYGDLWMDENTPNCTNPLWEGDYIRSEVVDITLENQSPTLARLNGVRVGFDQSSGGGIG
jgi:hypothetical protein